MGCGGVLLGQSPLPVTVRIIFRRRARPLGFFLLAVCWPFYGFNGLLPFWVSGRRNAHMAPGWIGMVGMDGWQTRVSSWLNVSCTHYRPFYFHALFAATMVVEQQRGSPPKNKNGAGQNAEADEAACPFDYAMKALLSILFPACLRSMFRHYGPS